MIRKPAGATLALCIALSAVLSAHPLSGNDAALVQGITDAAVAPFVYLGAKHMVTGYDHLLFLVGVIFFLSRPRDIVLYVSLFTLGHSLTLIGGVLGDVRVNPFLIDAVIGLSVVYKGFENIGGFERLLSVRPNTRAAVLVFGLFHGLGLASRVQEFGLAPSGLLANLSSFNIGVEIGQVLALGAIVLVLAPWRSHGSFEKYAFATNTALMTAGVALTGLQLVGYVIAA